MNATEIEELKVLIAARNPEMVRQKLLDIADDGLSDAPPALRAAGGAKS